MKTLLASLVVTMIACGSKAPPAEAPAPATTEPAGGGAANCCCLLADKSFKMHAPAECTTAGGTCQAEEDSCHGIEEPIP